MPMQAESLEILENAALRPAQARAIVRAIEIEIAGAKDTLATKHDLLVLRTDIRDEFAKLRVEVAEKINGLRAEVAEQIAELRSELHRSIGGIVRQMYLAILGQTAVMLGFAYFFATYLR